MTLLRSQTTTPIAIPLSILVNIIGNITMSLTTTKAKAAASTTKDHLKENGPLIIGASIGLAAIMISVIGFGHTRDTGSRGLLFDLPGGFGQQLKGFDIFGRGIGGVVESVGFSIIAIGELLAGIGKVMKAFGPMTTLLFIFLSAMFYFPFLA